MPFNMKSGVLPVVLPEAEMHSSVVLFVRMS